MTILPINRIVAIDPGKKTGIADWKNGSVEFHELDFMDTCKFLMGVASDYGISPAQDTLLVCESFIITPQTGKNTQAPWSLELIGVSRMVSEMYVGRPLIMQQAASAKRFSTDTRLKRMGWYSKGMGHANDAARHLLLLMATRGLLSQEVLTEFADMP